mmetsp:Transcript_59568/g.145992  ORF Transcript_59568/g.145992 Transcript_59568/m.145992 type:complete len:95 (-) Transcript_59568:175-459(-)
MLKECLESVLGKAPEDAFEPYHRRVGEESSVTSSRTDVLESVNCAITTYYVCSCSPRTFWEHRLYLVGGNSTTSYQPRTVVERLIHRCMDATQR